MNLIDGTIYDKKAPDDSTTNAPVKEWLRPRPNPAREQLILDYQLAPAVLQGHRCALEAYNVQGQLIKSEALVKDAAELSWPVAHWPAGLYLVILKVDDGARHYQKVMVQP